MLDFNRYQWMSFDCYGTIVDWETGISGAVAEICARHGLEKTREEILSLFADSEPKVQTSGEFLDYRTVLHNVLAVMARQLGIALSGSEADALSDSLPRWPVFPDAVPALKTLQTRYRLAIISNVDDDLFQQTRDALGIGFDAVVTSLQARSYKPDPRNFHLARERMGIETTQWLHVGESLYHDIGPANLLGLDSVWVNRPDRGGGTRPTDAVPSLVVPSLAELAALAVPSSDSAG